MFQTWWLARHTAGLLRKRVDDVCYAVTDLLVRGKQITIGKIISLHAVSIVLSWFVISQVEPQVKNTFASAERWHIK